MGENHRRTTELQGITGVFRGCAGVFQVRTGVFQSPKGEIQRQTSAAKRVVSQTSALFGDFLGTVGAGRDGGNRVQFGQPTVIPANRPRSSAGGAPEGSPRPKPWVNARNAASPGGAKEWLRISRGRVCRPSGACPLRPLNPRLAPWNRSLSMRAESFPARSGGVYSGELRRAEAGRLTCWRRFV